MRMGTPTFQQRPGLLSLPGFKPNAPLFSRNGWQSLIGLDENLGTSGVAFVDALTSYGPAVRLPAQVATAHPYLRKGLHVCSSASELFSAALAGADTHADVAESTVCKGGGPQEHEDLCSLYRQFVLGQAPPRQPEPAGQQWSERASS